MEHQTTFSVMFAEKRYSWDESSLWEYLEEGNIPRKWIAFFLDNQNSLYRISEELKKENPKRIYPKINHVFRAFIDPGKIKVVILGQDPYHNGSAVGYCFSVLPGNKINPSLRNIYKELKRDGNKVTEDGVLTHWVDQGCFMLNTALTVETGCADSHTEFWYDFTENVIQWLVSRKDNIAWLLMGSKSQKFQQFIPKHHFTFCTSHPSPFSAHKSYRDIPAFLGSGAFTEINKYLKSNGEKPIKW